MKKIKINYPLFFASVISGLVGAILTIHFSFSLFSVGIIGALIGAIFGIFSKKN
jgi:hypothetical protein